MQSSSQPSLYSKDASTLTTFLKSFRTCHPTSFLTHHDDFSLPTSSSSSSSLHLNPQDAATTSISSLSSSLFPKYLNLLNQISLGRSSLFEFELDDLSDWLIQNNEPLLLMQAMMNNTMRYIDILYQVIDEQLTLLEKSQPNISSDMVPGIDALSHQPSSDANSQRIFTTQSQQVEERYLPMEVLNAQTSLSHPQEILNPNPPKESKNSRDLSHIPVELYRNYELYILPLKTTRSVPIPLRQVRAVFIGKLVTIQGIVTRVTEVKPMIVVATYNCDQCGFEVYQTINSSLFMPLTACPSRLCKNSTKPGQLQMQTRGCKFVKYQEIKLQELASQVPVGHIPRSLNLQSIGSRTRGCVPGDQITVDAIFLPMANHGFKAMKAGLVADTFLLVQRLERQKLHRDEPHQISHLSPSLLSQLESFINHDDPSSRYTKLAQSLAPEIFGLEDVKKALLLQMVGGVTRTLSDGIRIRGDINICLMGDPGVAKSQLLKYITKIAPRAVYTSGKGSTGVGLTAAVLKDPISGEFILEGGSLTIADMGICCIDEFDKMDDWDRTAIHEAMEQQTISIAKAGITATLNARTAILAAANPLWGRYNLKKSPSENMNMPPSLLSRFDLIFVLLDRANSTRDRELAKHVTHVHRYGVHPNSQSLGDGDNGNGTLHPDLIRAYIGMARKINPIVPPSLSDYLVTAYIGLRESSQRTTQEKSSNHRGHNNNMNINTNTNTNDDDFDFPTARMLLGILRIAQALARLRFAQEISTYDVEEALRLLYSSKHSLRETREAQSSRQSQHSDPLSSIYNLIRNYARERGTDQIRYNDIAPMILRKGYNEELLNQVLDTYDQLGGVWTISANRQIIHFAF